jgi:hypothetical protein
VSLTPTSVAVGCPLTAAAVRGRRLLPVGLSVRSSAAGTAAGGRVVIAHLDLVLEGGAFAAKKAKGGRLYGIAMVPW